MSLTRTSRESQLLFSVVRYSFCSGSRGVSSINCAMPRMPGGADFMAHHRQEFALGPGRGLGQGQGLAQFRGALGDFLFEIVGKPVQGAVGVIEVQALAFEETFGLLARGALALDAPGPAFDRFSHG